MSWNDSDVASIVSQVGRWSVLHAFLIGAAAHGAPPTLTSVFPAGAQRGTAVTVTCSGEFPWPVNVWSPGITAVAGTEKGKLQLSIPADLPADRIWIRLSNEEGASALQPFLIGSLKDMDETEPNDRPKQANVLGEAQLIVNGRLLDRDVDCFSVSLRAGQTLVAAIDAHARLGSPMDAILQIVSSDGFVLAENHDDFKLDPRLAFTAPHDGTYVARLFAFPATPDASIRFAGGSLYVYRLTLTTGPYAAHAVPLAVSNDDSISLRPIGWNLPETPLKLMTTANGILTGREERPSVSEFRRQSEIRIGWATSPDFSLVSPVRVGPNQHVRMFDSDQAEPPTLELPTFVTAHLQKPRQRDVYRLKLSKGQAIVAAVESQELGFPMDPVLKLMGSDGSILAEADDQGRSRDAMIVYTAKEEGEYRLSVTDRYGHAGHRHWYLLTVREDTRDFSLSVPSDTVTVTHDKPAELTVKIERTGTAGEPIGPVTVEVLDLPAGVTCATAVSETEGATKNEVKLTLAGAEAAFSGPIRIVGKTTQPGSLERFARTLERLDACFESIWLTVIPKKPE